MTTVALLGNPNVGKTTVFNALTGSKQYVGNWPGVTIEKKEGFATNDIKVVDLPGIYAMDTFSNEEKVSKNFLESGDVDVIVDIVDASNLVRNLYLTTQLAQFNKPVILVLNMIDVAESKGIHIDYNKLSSELGVTVIPIVARKNEGINNIISTIESNNFNKTSMKKDFGNEDQTYKYLEKLVSKCTKQDFSEKESITEKIDKIVLNPLLAYPVFLGLLWLVFEFTFKWFGQPIADMLDVYVAEILMPAASNILSGSSPWFASLIVDGILGGVGSVIVFFPIVFALFLGLSLLEDSGYMARSAFLMDSLMRKIGLSGKAFIPLVMGFGCSTPAIMAARTLESEKDRKLTALLAPLMSCNARLTVYALFASIFFPEKESWVVLSLYILGIIIAVLVGLVLKNTYFNKQEEPFILELPEYKMPQPKSIIKHTWEKSKGFLVKAGTVIFSMSIVIWLVSFFNFSGYTTDINNSFLSIIGSVIAPIFAPLGFGTWQASVSLLTGLVAKEVVVGSMGVIYGDLTTVLPQQFTALTAYTFIVFVSLYTPCISVLATLKKEYGNKMMFTSFIYQLVLAWVISFVVYTIGSIFTGSFEVSRFIELAVTAGILAIAFKILYGRFGPKSSGCSSCSGCPHENNCSTKPETTVQELNKKEA